MITSGYGLSVGGVLVYEGNASNVMSDEETPTVVFDAVNNILSLSGASIPIMESNKPAIESSLASLTIQLDGSNCIIFNGDYSGYIVSSTNADATLTFSASDGAQLSANISDSQYVGSPANGFKTVSYNNSLGRRGKTDHRG